MTTTYSRFFAPFVLGLTATTLLTVPASPATSLLRGGRVRLTNTTGAAVTVTMYAIPVAGVASAGNTCLPGKSIAANDFMDVDLPIMQAGDVLQALAGTASAITAHMISGSLFS